MHGGSDEAFGASYREIAQSISLRPSDEAQDTLLRAIKLWFEKSASGDWTIVIDNLDDIEMRSRLYIPMCRGEILFTTRNENIEGGIVPVGAGIEVSRMGEKEAMETFCRIVGSEDPMGCPDTGQLLSLLDGLPLAIAQAATYIRTTRMPTADYLALLQDSREDRQLELFSDPLPAALPNNGADHSRAVMTTWALTVQKIEQGSPISVKLLQVMSFLDPDNIPCLFVKGAATALSTGTGNYYKQLAPLLNFGLLTLLESKNYRLHRLVSMWTRVKISPEVKHQRIDQAIGLMTRCLPPESTDNVTKYNEMLPHAVSILDHLGSDYPKFDSSWELQLNVAHFLSRIGQLDLAMKHARRSLKHEVVFEQDRSKRYITRARIGTIHFFKAEYATAINEYQLALCGLESPLGKGDPETLKTLNCMALAFRHKGDYGKALDWCQWALDGREKVLAP